MVFLHHVGKFYLKPIFFLHDFTLIALVVGESVIGHGILAGYISHLNDATCLKLVAGASDDNPSSPNLTTTQ